MKAVVFGGSGKIGTAVAWDLVRRDDVETVGLVGRRRAALQKTAASLKSKKLKVHSLDIRDKRATMKLMKSYNVGIIALPDRLTSYRLVDAAVHAGHHVVDMLEEYHRRPDAYEVEGLKLPRRMSLDEYGDFLHETAIENEVTFLDGIGFAPGISNITVGEAIRKLDTVETAVARVGGIPSKQAAVNHPLRYMITWAFRHVLREYMIKVKVKKEGKIVEVDATSDRETFRFNRLGVDEELQCAITPGMPSLIYSRPQLRDFAEKTIRWPTHWASVDTLKECGLLGLEPVQHGKAMVVPREFLLRLIEPRLQQRKGETDVCVMYNTVIGNRGGRKVRIEYFMWDVADTTNGLSSMARVTGFPSAIGAYLIGKGLITKRGIVPPEDCIEGEAYRVFMEEISKRGITILEEETPIA
jgi:saccharopine dehydrogenase-like NADP-dependent oxidoreductase